MLLNLESWTHWARKWLHQTVLGHQQAQWLKRQTGFIESFPGYQCFRRHFNLRILCNKFNEISAHFDNYPLWPCGVTDLGQYWFRQWLVACSAPSHHWHNVDLLPTGLPERNFNKFSIEYLTFHWRKSLLKRRIQNGGHLFRSQFVNTACLISPTYCRAACVMTWHFEVIHVLPGVVDVIINLDHREAGDGGLATVQLRASTNQVQTTFDLHQTGMTSGDDQWSLGHPATMRKWKHFIGFWINYEPINIKQGKLSNNNSQ